MACGEMAGLNAVIRGISDAAPIKSQRASGPKPAACRHIERTHKLRNSRCVSSASGWIRDKDRIQQRSRIWMLWLAKDLVTAAKLDDPPQVHDRNKVADS